MFVYCLVEIQASIHIKTNDYSINAAYILLLKPVTVKVNLYFYMNYILDLSFVYGQVYLHICTDYFSYTVILLVTLNV
jgi:hypothetical protein